MPLPHDPDFLSGAGEASGLEGSWFLNRNIARFQTDALFNFFHPRFCCWQQELVKMQPALVYSREYWLNRTGALAHLRY